MKKVRLLEPKSEFCLVFYVFFGDHVTFSSCFTSFLALQAPFSSCFTNFLALQAPFSSCFTSFLALQAQLSSCFTSFLDVCWAFSTRFTCFLAICLHFHVFYGGFRCLGFKPLKLNPTKPQIHCKASLFTALRDFHNFVRRFCFHVQASQGRRHPLTRHPAQTPDRVSDRNRTKKGLESEVGSGADFGSIFGPKIDSDRLRDRSFGLGVA